MHCLSISDLARDWLQIVPFAPILFWSWLRKIQHTSPCQFSVQLPWYSCQPSIYVAMVSGPRRQHATREQRETFKILKLTFSYFGLTFTHPSVHVYVLLAMENSWMSLFGLNSEIPETKWFHILTLGFLHFVFIPHLLRAT